MATKRKSVRVGMIGCGGISGAHLPHLSTSEDVELVAFCDVIVERAKKHADKYGGKAFDDARTMLESVEVDAAYILIPTYAHGEPERACLDAGVPFLVEKPLGICPEELRDLAWDIEHAGLITSAGFMNRYRKSINKARDVFREDPVILMDGAWIGGPPLARPGDYFASGPIGTWWPFKHRSGGQFVEQVIHTVDVARYLGGEVAEVFCFSARGFNQKLPNLLHGYDLDDAAVVSLRFESGAVANIMSCCSAGTGGGVFLNCWSAHHNARFTDWSHHLELRKQDGKTVNMKGDVDDIFPTEDRAFINAVKSGNANGIRSSHADGVKTTLVTLAANESLQDGHPVRVRYTNYW